MIKPIIKFGCFSTIFLFSVPAFANDHYDFKTCKEKVAEIQTKLSYAKQSNNQIKINKLERKLNRINIKCKDSYLQEKYQGKVDDEQEDVFEATDELKQAQQDGNAQIIAKRQKKLEEKQAEFKAAQTALETFKNKIKANQ
ncbi:DUF1090 domain-containing protein [Commensalibacter nepenthis]|uniref:DUF1090 domain-containing protein n=1 Tax=Commensalibacter nepenthis TaxID=3043872 RepID=A0ABT6Q745_9PROT|nr:DUF1090 domain-containing protein [Commensalibacter sp. TBRC 10068]MDI2112718.1 DUF1090 domain-containing protein [Commensalibacter sp. TBRC 10068]